MEKWKKDRNYRRIRDKDGNVIVNLIKVYGQEIIVSDEVFDAYASMDRRERYISEDLPAIKEVSLERLIQNRIYFERFTHQTAPSAEEIYIEHENNREIALQLKRLSAALYALPEEDYRLIYALFYENISVREYARNNGLSHTAVRKRRDKILEKIKEKI